MFALAVNVDTNTLKPFCKQVAILKKLSHPNVLPILGFTTEGQLRMVSSWMENGNIVNYLKTHRKKVRIPLVSSSCLIFCFSADHTTQAGGHRERTRVSPLFERDPREPQRGEFDEKAVTPAKLLPRLM